MYAGSVPARAGLAVDGVGCWLLKIYRRFGTGSGKTWNQTLQQNFLIGATAG